MLLLNQEQFTTLTHLIFRLIIKSGRYVISYFVNSILSEYFTIKSNVRKERVAPNHIESFSLDIENGGIFVKVIRQATET